MTPPELLRRPDHDQSPSLSRDTREEPLSALGSPVKSSQPALPPQQPSPRPLARPSGRPWLTLASDFRVFRSPAPNHSSLGPCLQGPRSGPVLSSPAAPRSGEAGVGSVEWNVVTSQAPSKLSLLSGGRSWSVPPAHLKLSALFLFLGEHLFPPGRELEYGDDSGAHSPLT